MSQERKTPEQKVALEKNVATSKPSQGGNVREQKHHSPQEEHVSQSGTSGVQDEHKDQVKFDQEHKEHHKPKPVEPKPLKSVAALRNQQVGTAGRN